MVRYLIDILLYIVKGFVVVCPWFLKRPILCIFWNYKLSCSAYIGLSWVFPVRLEMQGDARIGHLNFLGMIDFVSLGLNAGIGNLNWFAGIPLKKRPLGFSRNAELQLAEGACITNRHYFDVQDRFLIGKYTTIAGVHSVFFTHGIDLVGPSQRSESIVIEDHCMIGTCSRFMPGVHLKSCSLVAGGAVLPSGIYEPYGVYAGIPARRIRSLDASLGYFNRKESKVF